MSVHTQRNDRVILAARLGALLYMAWGFFHIKVAHDIYLLGQGQSGIAQGRTFQLAAYMLSISLFVVCVGVISNWRNSRIGFWLNLCVAGWADAVWVLVVVVPGYVDAVRGLVPPAIFIGAAIATTVAHRARRHLDA